MGDHHHHHHPPVSSDLKVAFALNLAFTVIEIGGGIWTNSIAILSDALHDAGDCFSLGLAWYLQGLAERQSDARFTYGYRRFSTLGALVTSVVLMAGLGFVGWQALHRLRSPEEVLAPGMIALAVIGIVFNGYAAWKLRGSGSLNARMASWHLIEDTLGWVAVLAGSIVIAVWHLPIIDPILSLAISAFVLWNVFRNLRPVALVFLQSAPPGSIRAPSTRKWPGCPACGARITRIPGRWTASTMSFPRISCWTARRPGRRSWRRCGKSTRSSRTGISSM